MNVGPVYFVVLLFVPPFVALDLVFEQALFLYPFTGFTTTIAFARSWWSEKILMMVFHDSIQFY